MRCNKIWFRIWLNHNLLFLVKIFNFSCRPRFLLKKWWFTSVVEIEIPYEIWKKLFSWSQKLRKKSQKKDASWRVKRWEKICCPHIWWWSTQRFYAQLARYTQDQMSEGYIFYAWTKCGTLSDGCAARSERGAWNCESIPGIIKPTIKCPNNKCARINKKLIWPLKMQFTKNRNYFDHHMVRTTKM